MFVDVEPTKAGSATQWIAEAGVVDLFVLPGPGPADVSAQYARLTGGSALPQMFSIAYHQCRRGGGFLGGGKSLRAGSGLCRQGV
jgi:alpha 1,3-glucosidase